MNWLLLFRLAFLLLTIAWSVQPALALKVATPTESLNWAVADSDVIVRGRIVGSYDSVPPEDAPTGARAYRHFTVKVTEALKGETSGTIKFCAELLYELYTLPWMENPSPREEMLFFLISAEKLKKRTELSSPEPLVLRYGEGSFVIWAFPLSHPQRYPREQRVYDLFFRRLTQTDEITAATRDALKARLVAPVFRRSGSRGASPTGGGRAIASSTAFVQTAATTCAPTTTAAAPSAARGSCRPEHATLPPPPMLPLPHRLQPRILQNKRFPPG